MATKKYDNGAGVKRFHYDVYELLGEDAYHIAPFTNESEAIRCAEAYAALAYVDREHFEIYPYDSADNTSTFVVRARATKDHNIFRHGSKDINRSVKNFGKFKAEFLTDMLREIMPEESALEVEENLKVSPDVKIHVEGPKTKGKKKKDKSSA